MDNIRNNIRNNIWSNIRNNIRSNIRETKGRKWTRHDLVVDGKKYSTFQRSIVEGVKAGDLVEVGYKTQGSNLVLLAVKVAGAPEAIDEEVPY